ncbi:MAG: methyltransferase domain-containing protein [Oscillospiraceae bacterium]|nr:methyltransferase domain-containing protein [Oscillospiraceae bacterium]
MRVETLGGGVEVLVSEAHTFGTDAFLLSDFASARRGEIACDLGCGCGIIPLLWFREASAAPGEAFGLELQPEAAGLAFASAARSGLEGRFTVLEGDLRNPPKELGAGKFDLVTCNPPYKKADTGILSESGSDRIARHETACTLTDVARASARLLRYGGRLCVCQLPERLPDIFCAMRRFKIEPKRLRTVQEREDTPPWLVLVEGRLGGKPFLRMEKPLILRENGADSPELRKIYHGYRK